MKVHSIQWHRAAKRQQRVLFIAFEGRTHVHSLTDITVSKIDISMAICPYLKQLIEPGVEKHIDRSKIKSRHITIRCVTVIIPNPKKENRFRDPHLQVDTNRVIPRAFKI